jgi:hypothetical protein
LAYTEQVASACFIIGVRVAWKRHDSQFFVPYRPPGLAAIRGQVRESESIALARGFVPTGGGHPDPALMP